jgi:hypothetical protein
VRTLTPACICICVGGGFMRSLGGGWAICLELTPLPLASMLTFLPLDLTMPPASAVQYR